MSNGQDFGWPNQYQQQGSGQQDPREQWPPRYGHPGSGQQGQGGPWQPEAYDPGQHHQRLGQPPQQPYPPQGQPWQQPGPWEQPSWQDPGQHQTPQPHRRERSRIPLYAGIAAVIVIAGGGAAYALSGHGSPSSAGSPAASESTAAAEPDTAAGVRAGAQQFYALYSASQWAAAWAYLAPAAQSVVSAATWTAVHNGCPGPTVGLARVIKSVTFAGTTAVVSETVAGSLGNLATVSDAWTYSGGRWGLSLPASSLSFYKHGSVSADIAAAKAAGECGS